jgi:hypothetical protein
MSKFDTGRDGSDKWMGQRCKTPMAKPTKSKTVKKTRSKSTPARGGRPVPGDEHAALKRLILFACTGLCILVCTAGVLAGSRLTAESVKVITVGAGLFTSVSCAVLGLRKL